MLCQATPMAHHQVVATLRTMQETALERHQLQDLERVLEALESSCLVKQDQQREEAPVAVQLYKDLTPILLASTLARCGYLSTTFTYSFAAG